MPRRIGRMLVLVLALAAAACTGGATDTDSTSPTDPGRLTVLDGSGNVIVMQPDGSDSMAITDDAGTDSAGYTQPVWSPDMSKLAWGQVTAEGFAVGIHDLAGGGTTTVSTDNLPFYISWSPDGTVLGVLHNGTSGVVFRLVDVVAGTSRVLDEDAPFYFTWSPGSDRVITHAGDSRVESVALDGTRDRLAPSGPEYLAPQWTERGVFHVVDGQLVVEGDGERIPVAEVSGHTNFVANPSGDLIALQTIGGGEGIEVALGAAPTIPAGDLVVVDGSGDVFPVTESPAAGFFWSPDGDSLLVFEVRENQLVPLVWAAASATEYEPFWPSTVLVRDVLPFFPQYAQSMSFWSPDASRFVFAGEIDDEAGIWAQDLSGADPTLISDGVWVDWSGPAG